MMFECSKCEDTGWAKVIDGLLQTMNGVTVQEYCPCDCGKARELRHSALKADVAMAVIGFEQNDEPIGDMLEHLKQMAAAECHRNLLADLPNRMPLPVDATLSADNVVTIAHVGTLTPERTITFPPVPPGVCPHCWGKAGPGCGTCDHTRRVGGMAMAGDALIEYTNYRGERAWRHIQPLLAYNGMTYDTSEYHRDAWVVNAWDYDKQAQRAFALSGIHQWFDIGRKNK